MYMLGRGPNLRTSSSLKMGKCCHGKFALVNEEMGSGHEGPGRWSEEECLIG